MSFDLTALTDAVAEHGRVARVVVAEVAGSVPREVGAAMLVWNGGQSGSIGGGRLEFEAAKTAFTHTGLSRHALGPDMGQCCGGRVTLLTEHFDAASLPPLSDTLMARGDGDMPLAVHRLLDRARAQGIVPEPQLIQGWMVEPITAPRTPIWIWGAGHVGAALANTLAPLPDMDVTVADTAPDRFSFPLADQVTKLPAADLPRLAAHAPEEARHIIVTYSHEIDLQLCHALLAHEFAFAGLIGSDTKWARFRKRLAGLGHTDAQIARICCPIGQKTLGKHPQAIAIGVAAQLVETLKKRDGEKWQTRSLG